ncbi:hypothetical protein CTEN210_09072 [Chaetoceros tenuissimus]|uniref:Phosphatidylinositol-3,4,5-trisphosphate 3-phosphatase n=1 Tax=Chaetoceros tenuissimus TaxID=426638 RepID=A0AAD3CWS2_9STRA|nr:hypothetical protein CTEN210_09072 [Chaetoceros tenuissimus]
MWSLNNLLSEAEAAKERIASAIANQGNSPAKKNEQNNQETAQTKDSNNPTLQPTIAAIPTKNEEMLSSLKNTWTNFAQATQTVTQNAIQNIEKEQENIKQRLFQKGPYKRDLSLSLDTESLKDAQVIYITDRLITMGHPAMQSAIDGDITPERKLAAIAHLLEKRHNGKFMIWNLSELEYDYSVFEDQVMTFEFPGSPSPPLGLMMKILLSLESWLKADEENVAVIHCLTGRGRTSTVMAAFLCWMGEAGFHHPNRALQYMAQCKKIDLETLTIPSQRRYVGYFTNMLDGVRPSQPPLLLKRIIMSEAPKYEKYQAITKEQADQEEEEYVDPFAEHDGELGCAPYLQIFKAGKLVFTTAASKSYTQGKEDLPFCFPFEKSITFPVETVVQGDILIRCRHLTRKGKRVSMFRAAMHTGYIPPKVMRLRRSEIDGACSDDRYASDFFIDLVFEECNASTASKHLLSTPEHENDTDIKFAKDTNEQVQNEASLRRQAGTVTGSEDSNAITVTASAYDSMLHRDSRFWDVIAERRNQKMESSDLKSVFYGPTIGRRREFIDEAESNENASQDKKPGNINAAQKNMLDSFTIGGELDFLSAEEDDANSRLGNEEDKKKESPVEKKDDLMDALNAIDDDFDDDEEEEEEEEEEAESEHKEKIVENDNDIDQNEVEIEEVLFQESTSPTTNEIGFENESENAEESVITEPQNSIDEKSPSNSNENETGDGITTSVDDDIFNLDDLDLDNIDTNKNTSENIDEDDGFDFSDDDDDLADLEDFLTKATG